MRKRLSQLQPAQACKSPCMSAPHGESESRSGESRLSPGRPRALPRVLLCSVLLHDTMARLLAALLLATTLASTAAHGGLTFPPPRNNHNNVDPRNISHANGNYRSCQGGPCSGDECLWFSEGCFIGCPSCSSVMPQVGGNYFGAPNCSAPAPRMLITRGVRE